MSLNDRNYLDLCKAMASYKPPRKKVTFDEIIDGIIECPRTAPIYPDEIVRPILRALGKRATDKRTHEAICLYGIRQNRVNAIFLIRIALRTNFYLAISGPPGELGGYMADFLKNGPIDTEMLFKHSTKAHAIHRCGGLGDDVDDVSRDYVHDFLASWDAQDEPAWKLENTARYATKIKPDYRENADMIVGNFTQDNPKLYMNPEFQKYDQA